MKRSTQILFFNSVRNGIPLLIMWCCTSFGLALDEVKNVVFYRAEIPASIISAETLMPGPSKGETKIATLVLQVLLEKDDCIIERLGKAAVINGEFNLDLTKAIFYVQPNGSGEYTFKKHADKVGVQAHGKVAISGDYYNVSLDLSKREIAKRETLVNQAESDKEIVQFINEAHISMPEFNTMHLSTSLLMKPGSPMPFGNMTVNRTSSDPADSSKRTTFYFILLD